MTTLSIHRALLVTPKRFGAKGNARKASGITTTAASAAITGPSGTFKPSDVGRPIYIAGANTNGTTLITTIIGYTSATAVTIGVNAIIALAASASILIGEDDTVAVQNAINYAKNHGAKAVILDGNFITQPLLLYRYASLIGIGRDSSNLYLKPGSATVNKYHVKPATNAEIMLTIEGITLHGMREFQTDGSGVVLKDIDGIKLDYSGGASEAQCYLSRLMVRDYGRAALRLIGKGRSSINGFNAFNCGYGIDVDSSDNLIINTQVQALGPGFFLSANAKTNMFVSCKGYRCGYSPVSPSAFEYCVWSLNGSIGNIFTSCEGSESWASNWYMFDAKRNTFTACRATDTGCLYTADGLGGDSSAQVRAGWQLVGASDDNRFGECAVSVVSHGVNNYATHAIAVTNTSANNCGRISTDKNANAFVTAKISRSTIGLGNTLRIDGESITADRHMIPVHVAQFFSQLTDGPTPVEVELPVNKVMVNTLNFNSSVMKKAQVRIIMPKSWDGGPITFDVKCSQATTAAGGVAWGLSALALANNSVMDAASSAPVVVTKVLGTANTEYVTSESGPITPAGATTGNITLLLTISRVVDDAADTLAQDVRLHEIRVYANLKQENDV